jgi:hypothetical protein
MARGSEADAGKPISVADAIALYEHDLIARGHAPANARRVRKHLPPALAGKPVGLLTAAELARWRDALLGGGALKRSSVRRPRASRLETRTARLKLPVRQKPYDFTAISPGNQPSLS